MCDIYGILAASRLPPTEGRRLQSDRHHLQSYLMLFTEFANLTLMWALKVRERWGLCGTIHLLSISNNITASKQRLQSQKTALDFLKITLEAAVTRPIIFNIRSYPCTPKAGSNSIQGIATTILKHANKFLFALLVYLYRFQAVTSCRKYLPRRSKYLPNMTSQRLR